ncbi:MAG: tetratricopeptide repeat protein [Rhodanobacteraceae bacterium]
MATPDAVAAELDRIAKMIAAGDTAQALERARRLHKHHPRHVEAARLYGIALLRSDAPGEARALFESLHRAAPNSVEVLCNLGSAALACGDTAAALSAYDKALRAAPGHPAALNGLGGARRSAGNLDGAREAYAASTTAAPGYVAGWLNLAAVELARTNAAEAERIARHATSLAPTYSEGWLLLGHVLAAQRRYADAQAAYGNAARADAGDARFAYQIGLMAEEQDHLDEAVDAYQRALELSPGFDAALGQLAFVKRRLCDWHNLDGVSARLRARARAGSPDIAPFAFLAEPSTPAEQLLAASSMAMRIDAAMAAERARLALAAHPCLSPDAPLRVGFVSNGFGEHPTGLLTVALFEALRGGSIETHLFATTADDGRTISRRLHRACRWHEVADQSPTTVAAAVHAAQIEILIDLRVWADGGMAEMFALRPAPIQVNWLAYPGTSGAPWIDYIIADRIVLPDAARCDFSERVGWLPRCYQPSDPGREVGLPPPRADCGLPDSGPVFVCFNNSYKLNRAGFERMLAILRAVPDAVLWLLAGPAGADRRLLEFANARNIETARLVFMPKLPHTEYLARYRHADLFLDTAPYNAHTTASDALWAGCPLLTVPGDTFASRVAASLNHHLGMDALNAKDDAAFVDMATRLGHNVDARTRLRSQLAERKHDHGLFDIKAYARDFSVLLWRMATRHRDGHDPATLD